MEPIGPSGRWGGRLTSRPLPDWDPELGILPDDARGELVAVWLGRAANERRVADAFVIIRRALEDLRADAALITLAARAVDDEHRHAELARSVAARVAGRELEAPPRLPLVVPAHTGAPPRLRAILHVVGHCAVNETFASALLESALGEARGALARAALRELLSDEIDHARIGWALLAALSATDRAELTPWLVPLVRANLKMWRETPRPYPTDPALHRQGAPSEQAVASALLGAIRDLVIPGFSRFGIATGEIARWLSHGAETS
jgi:hypothetical protein